MSARRILGFGLAAALAAGAAGWVSCSAIQKGTDILGDVGVVNAQDARTIKNLSEAVRNTFGDISEEEEYYIGRSVAALILARYPVHQGAALRQYVNTLASAVAVYSERPEIYAGYHVLILDTDEVNALAAPGGMIFLTKGLLKRCPDEDTLALILAHEISHISAKHGLQSIKKSRLVDSFRILGMDAVQRMAPENVAKLTGLFEEALGDIAKNLIERGYDRKYEYEADAMAVAVGSRTAYDPKGITRFLQTMVGDKSAESGKGWFKTHPSPKDRISKADKLIAAISPLPQLLAGRTARFKQAMAGVK